MNENNKASETNILNIVDENGVYTAKYRNKTCITPKEFRNSKLIKKYYNWRIFKKFAKQLESPVLLYIEAKINGRITPVPFAYLTKSSGWNIPRIDGDINAICLFDIPAHDRFRIPHDTISVNDMINHSIDFPYIISLKNNKYKRNEKRLFLELYRGEFYIMWDKEQSVCFTYEPSGSFPGAEMYCQQDILGIVIKRDSVLFDTMAIINAYWEYNFYEYNPEDDGMYYMKVSEARKSFKETIDI